MYQLENNQPRDTEYFYTLMSGKHIISSSEARAIRDELARVGALPHLDNYYDWAMLCMGYCFANGWTSKADGLLSAPNAKGMDIASFTTCFTEEYSRLWLALLSETLFDNHPNKAASKDDLYRLIADLWHTGAVKLNEFWARCKQFKSDDELAARQLFLNELADLAIKNAGMGGVNSSGSLKIQNTSEIPLENALAECKEMGEKIVTALQSMGKGVKKIAFLGQGVRYDNYLVQFADYVDWDRLHERFCSAMGISKNNNQVLAEQFVGLSHAYKIKILRDESSWRALNKANFESALQQYQGKFLIPCCIGADENGQAVFADLYEAPHILVGGTTRMGKSVLVSSIMRSLFTLNQPHLFEAAIFDPAANYTIFKNESNLWQKKIHGERSEFLPLLENLVQEMNDRLALLREYDAEKIQNLPKEKQPKLLIILLEELAALLDTDKDAEKPIIQMLQEGAKTGIHLILVTQEPNSQTFSSKLLANLPSRISLRVVKPGSSRMILGESGAEYLTSKGDHFVKWNGAEKQFLHGYNV